MVELSSYGLRLKMFENLRGQVGIIIRLDSSNIPHKYAVRWTNTSVDYVDHYRKDIKMLKE